MIVHLSARLAAAVALLGSRRRRRRALAPVTPLPLRIVPSRPRDRAALADLVIVPFPSRLDWPERVSGSGSGRAA